MDTQTELVEKVEALEKRSRELRDDVLAYAAEVKARRERREQAQAADPLVVLGWEFIAFALVVLAVLVVFGH